jgi:hypothetical protein
MCIKMMIRKRTNSRIGVVGEVVDCTVGVVVIVQASSM